jgi:exosortase/archaeosortase family protein
MRRAGWIFLALAFPMFWSKRLFNILAEYFLSLDAILVSSITHTQRISNLVEMPGGDGFLEIAPRCSSMANVSLAVLCWVLFTQTRRTEWRPANIVWCSAACLLVIVINVTRISLIGFFPSYYDLLHGDVGSTITNWLTVIAVFAVCNYGARRAPLNSI